jgi:hypothetical protein
MMGLSLATKYLLILQITIGGISTSVNSLRKYGRSQLQYPYIAVTAGFSVDKRYGLGSGLQSQSVATTSVTPDSPEMSITAHKLN